MSDYDAVICAYPSGDALLCALARTVRRLNALDSIVIPELAREIHRVASALEEEERDEAVRRSQCRTGRMPTP